MGSPQRCQVRRPEGAGLEWEGHQHLSIHAVPGSPLPASNKSSLEEAQSCSPPGDATWTLYSSTGLWGGFQCRRADPSVKFNARSWVGPSGTGQEQGAQRHSYPAGSSLTGGWSPEVSFARITPFPRSRFLFLYLSWCWGQPFLPVVRNPVRGSLSSKPRTETTVTS